LAAVVGDGCPADLLASSLFLASIGALAKRDRNRGAERRTERPSEIPLMQDWILILTPVSLVTFFLVYPDHFHHVLAWFGHLIR
jgi:hypothetical protein